MNLYSEAKLSGVVSNVILILLVWPHIAQGQEREVGGENIKKVLMDRRNQMPALIAPKLRVGIAGRLVRQGVYRGQITSFDFKVVQVLQDKRSAIISCTYSEPTEQVGDREVQELVFFRLKNFDFRNMVDDQRIFPFGSYLVAGTFQYVNVAGATSTIFDVEPIDVSATQDEVHRELRQAGKPSLSYFRTWSFKDGTTLFGLWIECENGPDEVRLRQRSGGIITVKLDDLSAEDQDLSKEFHEAKFQVVAGVVVPKMEFRVWTDKKGRQVEAAYMGMERQVVKLQSTTSTKPIFIRFQDLSKEDKEWIGNKRKAEK